MTKQSSTIWRRVAVGASALVLVASLVPAVAAQEGGGRDGKGRQFGRMGRGGAPLARMGFALRGLELTDAQRQQVRTLVRGHDEEFKALGARARTARQKLHAATIAEPVNEAAIRSASSEVADVQADAAVLRARVRQEVWNVLTPEQREKAKTLQAEREKRMQERRERMQERIKARRGNAA